MADHQADPTTTEVDELRVKLPRAEAAFILYLLYYTDQFDEVNFDDFQQIAAWERHRFWQERPRSPTQLPPLPADVTTEYPAAKVGEDDQILERWAALRAELLSLRAELEAKLSALTHKLEALLVEPPVGVTTSRMAPGAQVTAEVRNEVLQLLIEGSHRRYGLLGPADVDFGAVLPSYQRRTELRRTFGISRKDFASLLGVSTRTLHFWETDRDPDPGRDIRYGLLLMILEGEAQSRQLELQDAGVDDTAWLRMVKTVTRRRSKRNRRGDPDGLTSAAGYRPKLQQLRCDKCGAYVSPYVPCKQCAMRTDKDAEKQRRLAQDPQ